MWVTLLALLASPISAVPSSPAPSINSVHVVSTNAGACAAPGAYASVASLAVEWGVVDADSADYELRIYENGALRNTLDCATTSWSKNIPAAVENGSVAPWQANWGYRIDVVRLVDGVVVNSASTASNWTQWYGGC